MNHILKVSSGEQLLVLWQELWFKIQTYLFWMNLCMVSIGKTNKMQDVIEQYCAQPDKTMIYVTHRQEEIPTSVTKFF